MRRLALIAILLPLLASAQTRSGPRAGVSLATISNGGLFAWNGLPQVGPILGWSWEVPWTRQVSFLIEPMYIGKGSLIRNATLDQMTSTRYGFLELPVIVKISTDTVPRGFFISTGIMGSYWMTGRQTVRQQGTILTDSQFDLSNSTRRWSYGFALGLGVDKKNLSYEVRAQTSISPFSAVYIPQNLVFGVHVTYYIPRKGTRKDKEEDE